MIDQEQATQNSETQNSEEKPTNEAETTANTSTTAADDDDESINLGEGGDEEEQDKASEEEDTRTDEEKAADEAAEAERQKLFGAPEGDAPYEISGLPEGMEVDQKAVDALTPLAKKIGLSNEGFSALAQVYATEVLPNVTQQVVTGIENDVLAQRKAWENEARDFIAGKGELKTQSGEKIDFGGLSLKETQKLAAKALDKFAPDGFRKWLDETGLGVNPHMIAFAYNVGRDVAEDRDVEETETKGGKKSGGDGRPMTDASKFYSH